MSADVKMKDRVYYSQLVARLVVLPALPAGQDEVTWYLTLSNFATFFRWVNVLHTFRGGCRKGPKVIYLSTWLYVLFRWHSDITYRGLTVDTDCQVKSALYSEVGQIPRELPRSRGISVEGSRNQRRSQRHSNVNTEHEVKSSFKTLILFVRACSKLECVVCVNDHVSSLLMLLYV